MKKKIIGILICLLLFSTVIPLVTADENKAENYNVPGAIWFVRGIFRYVEEDEDYIYVEALYAKLFGIMPGVMWYSLHSSISIKLGKPFMGLPPQGSAPSLAIGICYEWDYT